MAASVPLTHSVFLGKSPPVCFFFSSEGREGNQVLGPPHPMQPLGFLTCSRWSPKRDPSAATTHRATSRQPEEAHRHPDLLAAKLRLLLGLGFLIHKVGITVSVSQFPSVG